MTAAPIQFRRFRAVQKQQGNFALVGLIATVALSGILAVYGYGKQVAAVDDAAAEATGRYLIKIRSALVVAMSKHMDTLMLQDTSALPSGSIPAPPAWTKFTGTETTITVADLKTSKFLDDGFPSVPPRGRSVHISLRRTGTCPGDDCQVTAYAYTCWPISRTSAPGTVDPATCPAAPAGWQYSSDMVGKVMESTDGYGANNSLVPGTMRGPLFSMPVTDLGIPSNSAGTVAVIASLNDNLFPQFVRQGDTRQIYLKNTLSVAKQISTDEGLVMNTAVSPNGLCDTQGAYATTVNTALAICTGGRWFEMSSHVITSAQSLANGAAVNTPTCPGANMTPFSFASLQNLDVTMTGSDINVSGTVDGGITGTGNVSSSGSVSVSGSFNGTTQSSSASSIRVAQSVSIVAGRVVITPATASARAMVILGCQML